MKEIIHFAHGNGFPSMCYKQLLNELEVNFDCYVIDRIGHSPHFPVTDNWHLLTHEIEDNIRKISPNKPVIAVGHSLGGVLSAMLAIDKPHLFKAIILLDSPLIGRIKSHTLWLCKTFGVIDRVTPAFQSKARRRYWENKKSLIDYLRNRKLFENFSDACLEDYITYGMQQDEAGGYSLRFNPCIEYQIYRTMPHNLFKNKGKLKVPTALIYGKNSNIIKASDLMYMKKNYNITSFPIEGGHMFPLEHPEKAGKLIIKTIRELLR